MLVHCRKQPLSRDGKQRGSVCVNQIHLVTSKSGFRKKLLRVDEHSPSLFIGQGPQLRGGCHRLTLKSVLRADNVYILPAHYPISPSFLTYICLPPAEMAPRTYYLKPHDTGLGLPGFLFLFLLFLKAEIIFFHKVLTTMCKQICASEEVKQTKLSFPYYPQGGAVVLSLTHFRSFKKKEQKKPNFYFLLETVLPPQTEETNPRIFERQNECQFSNVITDKSWLREEWFLKIAKHMEGNECSQSCQSTTSTKLHATPYLHSTLWR